MLSALAPTRRLTDVLALVAFVALVGAASPVAAQLLDVEPFMAIDGGFDAGVYYGNYTLAPGSDSSVLMVTGSWKTDSAKQKAVAQRFGASGSAVGDLIRLDETQDVSGPAVTSDSRGGFVAHWSRNVGIPLIARLLDGAGNPTTPPFTVLNSGVFQHVVAGLPTGVVVAWSEPAAVKFRLYDVAGQPIGQTVEVATFTPYTVFYMAVVGVGGGGFAVAWDEQDGPIRGRMYDAAGTPLGAAFAMTDDFALRAMAASPNGGFVVVGPRDTETHARPAGVWARRFDDAGVASGPAFVVDVLEPGSAREARRPRSTRRAVSTSRGAELVPRIAARARLRSRGAAAAGVVPASRRSHQRPHPRGPTGRPLRRGLAAGELRPDDAGPGALRAALPHGMRQRGRRGRVRALRRGSRQQRHDSRRVSYDVRLPDLRRRRRRPQRAVRRRQLASAVTAATPRATSSPDTCAATASCRRTARSNATTAPATTTRCRTRVGPIAGVPTAATACSTTAKACDDGNRTSCDGCSDLCVPEPGLVCGDGIPEVLLRRAMRRRQRGRRRRLQRAVHARAHAGRRLADDATVSPSGSSTTRPTCRSSTSAAHQRRPGLRRRRPALRLRRRRRHLHLPRARLRQQHRDAGLHPGLASPQLGAAPPSAHKAATRPARRRRAPPSRASRARSSAGPFPTSARPPSTCRSR